MTLKHVYGAHALNHWLIVAFVCGQRSNLSSIISIDFRRMV